MKSTKYGQLFFLEDRKSVKKNIYVLLAVVVKTFLFFWARYKVG